MKRETYFNTFFIFLLIFISTGLALSFSLSYSFSLQKGRIIQDFVFQHDGILKLFIKQLLALCIGVIGIYIILKTPSKIIRELSFILCIIGLLSMIYTMFAGTYINGARRWIRIAGISLQTGDFARIALTLYISNILAQFHSICSQFQWRGGLSDKRVNKVVFRLMSRLSIMIFLYIGTLYFQQDYSSFLMSGIVVLALLFSSDIPSRWKGLGFVMLCVVFFVIVINSPNRVERIITFLKPNTDRLDIGFQLSQSYNLIKQGGFFGRGVGANMFDVLALPYFYNDFVFSVIISEFGLIGSLMILVLFWMLFIKAFSLCKALYSIDRFYFYIVLSSITYIIVSVSGHIAVSIGLVPTAGLNMPFYSTGGSSLVTSLFAYGFILKAAVVYENKLFPNIRDSHIIHKEKILSGKNKMNTTHTTDYLFNDNKETVEIKNEKTQSEIGQHVYNVRMGEDYNADIISSQSYEQEEEILLEPVKSDTVFIEDIKNNRSNYEE